MCNFYIYLNIYCCFKDGIRVELPPEASIDNDDNQRSFISVDAPFKKYSEFIDSFLSDINTIQITHKDKDKIFTLCRALVENIGEMNIDLIVEQSDMTPVGVLKMASNFITNKIGDYASRYKRDKKMNEIQCYIPSQERAIGTRIDMIYNKNKQVEIPTLVQSTLQYIPIISSLRAFLADNETRELYFEHQNNHHCKANIYERFCCGTVCRSNDFFRENPHALQIQLSIDDFEICNPLGSKSGLHKVCGIYFVVNNMPKGYNSKLQNIVLVALCNTDDLDTPSTDINSIWAMIVSEIKYLEDVGIDIGNGIRIKGTIINLTADNLGANAAFCLTKGFRSHNYCRICLLTKNQCEQAIVDDPSKYRDVSHYQQILKLIDECSIKQPAETYGIKQYCVLNDLKYFHIFKNFSVDIMHDLCEGVIPCLLKKFILYCIGKKVFKEIEIKNSIQHYSFPKIYRRDKPSILRLDRSNLGQNAVQMKCLLLNIPFILNKYKFNEHLKSVWVCVSSLIKIFQFAYSEIIDEIMLNDFSKIILIHLENMKKIFDLQLKPKHHFLTHYPTIVRMMGPLNSMSMIRYEAKHKFFKSIAKRTNNFVNINSTLATAHQRHICIKKRIFYNDVSFSRERVISLKVIEDKFGRIPNLQNTFTSTIFEIYWLKLNIFKYDYGTIIVHGKNLCKIEKIIRHNSQTYFICCQLKFLGLDEFSRSIETEYHDPMNHQIIELGNLCHRKPYSAISIDNRRFIIIDNYDVLNLLLQ